MPVRVPLFACFVALLGLAVASIATLVGVLDSLLADEARRSAVASVNGALDHAVELVAEPFRDVVPLTRRMAELSRERNDRCDDGRTTGAAFETLHRDYLATISGARTLTLFALYQAFRVTAPTAGISVCGCVPGAYCFFYASSALQHLSTTWPNSSSTITQSDPAGWNNAGLPFADRAMQFRKGSALAETGEWGPPELFVDPVSGSTVLYITFEVPIFFDPVTNLSIVTEAIDLQADGLQKLLEKVRLPRTRVALVHPQTNVILASTFPGVPLFNKTAGAAGNSSGGAAIVPTSRLWSATRTPSSELNTVVSTVAEENGGSLNMTRPVVDIHGHDTVTGAAPVSFNTLQLTIVTSTDKDYFFDTLVKARIIGISIAVGCALLCVVLSVLVSVLVQRGISKLQAAMGPASRLECDPEKYAAEGTSVILDIARLQEAFGVMNTNLHIAGEYLPQSVKAAWAATTDDESDEGDGEDHDGEGGAMLVVDVSRVTSRETDETSPTDSSSIMTPRSSSQKLPIGAERRLSRSGVSDTSVPRMHPHRSEHCGDKLASMKSNRTFRIAVLCLNLVGFKRLVHTMNEQDLIRCSADLTTIVLAAAKAHKGVVDTFQGDRYTVTFNAVVPCAAAARQAAATALEVSAAVADHGELSRCLVSSGVAYGQASVGDIGCATMRRFGVLGDVVAQAAVLERLCRGYIVFSSVSDSPQSVTDRIPDQMKTDGGSKFHDAPRSVTGTPSPAASFAIGDYTPGEEASRHILKHSTRGSYHKPATAPTPTHVVCVVAQNAAQDLRVHFDLVGVDCVRLPGAAAATVLSAVVSQRREDKEDEWLYIVGDDSHGEGHNSGDAAAKAFAGVLRGDITAANEFLARTANVTASVAVAAAAASSSLPLLQSQRRSLASLSSVSPIEVPPIPWPQQSSSDGRTRAAQHQEGEPPSPSLKPGLALAIEAARENIQMMMVQPRPDIGRSLGMFYDRSFSLKPK